MARNSLPGTRRTGSAPEAFTLLELLVVIGIILVLAGLLLPALGSSKLKAQRKVCENNLKQLAVAWTTYCGDNNGRLPSCVPSHPFSQTNLNAWVLGNAQTMPQDVGFFGQVDPGVLDPTNAGAITRGTLFPYTRSRQIYRCPLDQRTIEGVPYVRTYSMNNWMNGSSPADWIEGLDRSHTVYKTDSTLPAPSQHFVFLDEDPDSINDAMFVVIVDPGWYMNDIPTRIHKAVYPLSFADGHTEAFKIRCSDTLAWDPSKPDPPEISSDGTPNQDLLALRRAAFKTER